MAVAERRTDVRAPVSLMGAVVAGGDEAPVLVLDLSSTGVRLQADSPPDPDHEYQLFFSVHRTDYSPRVRVVHWTEGEGTYNWGCTFCSLPDDQQESLRRTVRAAAGLEELWLREWTDVAAEAASQPGEQIVVGATPSGRDIRLPGADCIDIGQDGVELFVTTVASLENT